MIRLSGNFSTASRVVLKASFGTLVVVVTHQEGDPDPGTPLVGCTGKGCRPSCTEGTNGYACQTVAAEALGLQDGGPNAVHVLMGDGCRTCRQRSRWHGVDVGSHRGDGRLRLHRELST